MSLSEKYKTDPGLAAVFSFLFSGLGQIYNGQIRKGMTIMMLSAFAMVIVIVGAVQIVFSLMPKLLVKGNLLLGITIPKPFLRGDLLLGIILLAAGILLMAAVGTYTIYDAYNTAKKKSEE